MSILSGLVTLREAVTMADGSYGDSIVGISIPESVESLDSPVEISIELGGHIFDYLVHEKIGDFSERWFWQVPVSEVLDYLVGFAESRLG